MVWDTEVRQAVAHWGPYFGVALDPALIHAVIERESAHGRAPNYIAHGGVVPEAGGHLSYGPMQIYDDTVRTVLKLGFPAADLATHPELGIWYGVKEFARRMKLLGGDPVKAVSAWNAGTGGVGTNPAYVNAVLGFWKTYKGAVVSIVPALVLALVAFWFLTARRRSAA